VTFRLAVALTLFLAAAVLLLVARRHREQQAAATLATLFSGDRPSSLRGGPDPRGERSCGRWPGRGRRLRARAPTSEEVAASMVLLAVALQSGCGVVEAIEHVAEVAPPVPAAELAVVAAALRWGLDEEWAWAEVDPRWSRAAMALRLARAAGVAPSSLLLTGADDLRSNRLAAIDVAAARLGVRLVVPLGVAFLPAFVLTTIVPVVLALARQVLAS
jgi:hypothetical protein